MDILEFVKYGSIIYTTIVLLISHSVDTTNIRIIIRK